MIKNLFLFVFIIFCLSKKNCSCTEVQRKNVLLIMVDDLRPALRAAGDKNAITPNIDKLLERSSYFTRAFAQQSLCAPSRNSILTSRRPDTLKLYDFYSYWRDVAGDFTTMPQYFKENGYFTYSIGKVFHPGMSSNFTDDYPASWSLPTFHPKTEPYLNSPLCVDKKTAEFTNNLLCPVDLDLVPFNTLPDIESTNHGIDTLQQAYRNTSLPFFIAIGYHKPHIPFMFPYQYLQYHHIEKFNHPNEFFKSDGLPAVAWAPFNDLRKRQDVEGLNLSYPFGTFEKDFAMEIRQHYYASVTYVDALLGKLLDKVNYNNTIVVLVSDHGWSLGEHAEWAKYSNLDVALKVPLIIYDPIHKETRKPQTIREVVELVDIFPTLVQLSGLPKVRRCNQVNTNMCTEGKSLGHLLRKRSPPRDYTAFSQYPRPGLFPSFNPNSDEPRLKDIQVMGYTIRTKQFRYTAWIPFDHVSFLGDWTNILAEELYDHSFDDAERINLASRPELFTVKTDLFERLKQKMKK